MSIQLGVVYEMVRREGFMWEEKRKRVHLFDDEVPCDVGSYWVVPRKFVFRESTRKIFSFLSLSGFFACDYSIEGIVRNKKVRLRGTGWSDFPTRKAFPRFPVAPSAVTMSFKMTQQSSQPSFNISIPLVTYSSYIVCSVEKNKQIWKERNLCTTCCGRAHIFVY